MIPHKGHRFSNTRRTRNWVAGTDKYSPAAVKFDSWESIPLHLRLLILEHISLAVQEVLRGKG